MIKNKKVFIIAEAGVNHNGSLATAKKMVDAAAKAGADAVKFQTFVTDRLVMPSAPKAPYQKRNARVAESQASMLKALELSPADYTEIAAYCKRRGIVFMSTPFDEESADLLNKLGVPIFKIPSGEITNESLIRHIASKGKSIILSTGMATLDEIAAAIRWIRKGQSGKPTLVLLHCVSAYPARHEDMNLRAMLTLSRKFRMPIGLSDHTLGMEIAIAAVAMGARVIEKHFTIDRRMSGPDHKMSMEPKELQKLVHSIRNVETAFGNGVKKPSAGERVIRKTVRRSIVAGRDILPGQTITASDIVFKRPGTGLPSSAARSIIGHIARNTIKKDMLIRLSDLVKTKKR